MFRKLTEIAAAVALSFAMVAVVTVAVYQFAASTVPVEVWLGVMLAITGVLWVLLGLPRRRPPAGD